jgi:uncharacterized membrane protein
VPAPGWRPLAGLLAVAGVSHVAVPRVYDQIVPRRLGNARAWTLASGIAELACAAGLAVPRTRRTAALASAALFVGVYPANVNQAVLAHRNRATTAVRAASLVRLPMQVPLVIWALRLARREAAVAQR